MSEVTFEQLKSLFENLQDRLDKTAGDKLTADELSAIRAILDRQSREIKKLGQNGGNQSDPREFINQFWASWRANQPLRPLTEAQRRQQAARPTGDSPTDPEGQTYIRRKQLEAAAGDDVADSLRKSAKAAREETMGRRASFANFMKSLDTLGGRMSSVQASLAKGSLKGAFGGGMTGKALDAVQDRIDEYKNLNNSGEDQFSSIQQMTNAVNDAHMSVQELSKAVQDSQGARQLGGKDYAALTGALTRATNDMGNMALSFDQRQELMQEYLDIQNKQGNIRNLSQDQMVSGIKNLEKSSAETASILGMTRKEALEAQKAQAADANWTTFLNSMNLSQDQQDQANQGAAIVQSVGGDVANQLLKQLSQTGTATGEASRLAGTDPDLYNAIKTIADANRGGKPLTQQEVSSILQQYGKNQNQALARFRSNVGTLGIGDNVGAFTASNQAAINARNLKDGVVADKTEDAGTRAAVGAEEAMRSLASVVREAADTLANSILDTQGDRLEALKQGTIDNAEAARQKVRSFQDDPDSEANVAKFAIAVGAAVLGLTALNGIFKTVGAGLKMWQFAKGAVAGPGRAAAARGAATGAAEGAAGAAGRGGARTGGTWIGDRLRGAAGAAEGAGAGAIAKGLGRAVGKNALVGSLFEGFDYLTGNKSLSWKNLAKSGLRVGGGALGGLAGGGIGSIATGAAGYYAGDALGNWLLGEDDKPGAPQNPAGNDQGQQSSTGSTQRPTPIAGQPQRQRAPQGDATGQKPRNALTPEQMNQKIMEASERAANYLKGIKENSDKQLDLMREEIAVTRRANERTHRLLEDGNKNTRFIADHSS